MKISVLLPNMGFPISDAVLSAWIAADGAVVTKGDPLYEIDCNKSIQKIGSPKTGRLTILVPSGARYKVGHALAYIDTSVPRATYDFPPRMQLD